MGYNIEHVRRITRQLANRARQDEEFKEQLINDPLGTLRTANIPEEALSDVMRETDLADVAGYAKPQCLGSFCIVDTCFITL